MGYRSDIIIALEKKILTYDLISPIIPTTLSTEESYDIDNTRYWLLSGWKWYDGYPEVEAMNDFFDRLEDLNNTGELTGPDSTYLFGAMRLGEEYGDVVEWGDPYLFDIYCNHSMSFPQ